MDNFDKLQIGNTIQLDYDQDHGNTNKPLIARIMQIEGNQALAMCAFVNAKMRIHKNGLVETRHPSSSDWYPVGNCAEITILK